MFSSFFQIYAAEWIINCKIVCDAMYAHADSSVWVCLAKAGFTQCTLVVFCLNYNLKKCKMCIKFKIITKLRYRFTTE